MRPAADRSDRATNELFKAVLGRDNELRYIV